mmetsp:Transcript_170536/g.546975  ORF Transcript_170536/g.546975 Transcript_170536/m.546975 type:complete len:235 (-) Transcript_170536:589-1293(-)
MNKKVVAPTQRNEIDEDREDEINGSAAEPTDQPEQLGEERDRVRNHEAEAQHQHAQAAMLGKRRGCPGFDVARRESSVEVALQHHALDQVHHHDVQKKQDCNHSHRVAPRHAFDDVAFLNSVVVPDQRDGQICRNHDGPRDAEGPGKVSRLLHGVHHLEVHPLTSIAVHDVCRRPHGAEEGELRVHRRGLGAGGPSLHGDRGQGHHHDGHDQQRVDKAERDRLRQLPSSDDRQS